MADYLVSHLGHRGDGIVLDQGDRVFAPFALPGERVTGRLEDDRLSDLRVLEPSADRVKPSCSHFKTCGGCVMQHASADLQQDWRVAQIEEPLRQVGIDKKVERIHTSPAASRRRVGFTARRSKAGGQLCFYREGSHELVDVTACAVVVPQIADALDDLRVVAGVATSRKSVAQIFVQAVQNGLDVSVEGAKDIVPEDLGALARLPSIVRLVWNGEVAFQKEAPFVQLSRAHVPIAPGAFLQASSAGEGAMSEFACSALAGRSKIADLFAGYGTFALALAEDAEVAAFEGDLEAMDALRAASQNTDGIKSVATQKRDLFRDPVTAKELDAFDAVILDPPRAGAAAQITEIAASKLCSVAYVSCNPASYARDAAALVEAGFSLERLEAVDQFRWSRHVELLSYFSR